MIIRSAMIEDATDIIPLMDQLGYETDQIRLENRFKKFINSEGYGVSVACINDEIVGLIAWSKSLLFVADKIRFHIEALIVDQNHHGKNIGKNLVLFVEEIAYQHRPAIVDLTSGTRRAQDGTHQFYKKLGYQNDDAMGKLHFRKEFK